MLRLAFILPVADGDPAEMVTDEGGHGHASGIGLFLEGGPFLIGEADPEHVGTGFWAHVFIIVLLVAYMKTRLPDIATQIGPWSGGYPLTTLYFIMDKCLFIFEDVPHGRRDKGLSCRRLFERSFL